MSLPAVEKADGSPFTAIIRLCTGLKFLRKCITCTRVSDTSLSGVSPSLVECARGSDLIVPFPDRSAHVGCHLTHTDTLHRHYSIIWTTYSLDHDLKSILAAGHHKDLQEIILNEDIDSRADIHLDESTFDCLVPILGLPRVGRLSAPLSALHLSQQHHMEGSVLQQLDLHHTQLSEEGLGTILALTPQLKVLKYWSCYDLDGRGRPGRLHIDDFLDCQKLGRSLRRVQSSLEELSLSFAYFSFGHDFVGMGK